MNKLIKSGFRRINAPMFLLASAEKSGEKDSHNESFLLFIASLRGFKAYYLRRKEFFTDRCEKY